jgi:hypothetical protein
MNLFEGGNVFKDKNGNPLTRRIAQNEIMPTVNWLESLTGLDFTKDLDDIGLPTKWIGSTGRKADSGDIDLAIDAKKVDKSQVKSLLDNWAKSNGLEPKEWTKMSGNAVHFRTPIKGDPRNGFAQTDFMFLPNLKWGIFFLSGGRNSSYSGTLRNILLSSMAKIAGKKAGPEGIFDRTTGDFITDDPRRAAKILLMPQNTERDLQNVEAIYKALTQDPNRDKKLADFRSFLARDNIAEPGIMQENEINFLARLRDRIVNQGMTPLVEQSQDPAPVGGKAKGIEHLEDYVFRKGTSGIRQALDIAEQTAKNSKEYISTKWDGKPAVIFGRKPDTGEFVLTDVSGFTAKGYDGLATSPAMMANIQNSRGPNRADLIAEYTKLFPLLNAALPSGFKGYVHGDVIFMDQPPEVKGNYEFQRNEVPYKIPVNSELGHRISNSDVGIAVHTQYADQGNPKQLISNLEFNSVPGLLIEKPVTLETIVLNDDLVKEIRKIITRNGSAINKLLNPAELRQNKITDLARLAVDFVNTKVGQELDRNTLAKEFIQWLPTHVSPNKYKNIINYLQSNSTNVSALAAAFDAFYLLHELKVDIQLQGDRAHPGQEGWVMATPAGYAKAVGRFSPQSFIAKNRQRNNPRI